MLSIKRSLFVVILPLVLALFLFLSGNKSERVTSMKIAFPYLGEISQYDPAEINFAGSAIISMNLYGSLLEYDQNGNVGPGLAMSYEWLGEKLFLKIRKDLKTPRGATVTSEDVFLSMKRLILKKKNTHGHLQSFICPGYKIDSMEDPCPGLEFDRENLILTVPDVKKRKFLVPLLAAPDFRVLPKGAIDWESKEKRIKDYGETTGLYYYESTLSDGSLVLKANENHYQYNSKKASEVILVPSKIGETEQMLEDGAIDAVTTIGPITKNELSNLGKKTSEYHIHRTENIELFSIKFLPKLVGSTSVEERKNISKLVKKVFLESFRSDPKYESTNEFFPIFGEGGLGQEQKDMLKSMWDEVEIAPLKRKYTFSVERDLLDEFKALFSDYENIEIVPMTGASWLDEESYPEDGYIVHGDTGFLESISLLTYYLGTGVFGMTREESVEWIEAYMEIENKEERLKKLRDLHFEFLTNVNVVPIAVAPFVAVSRKPWKADLYKYFAGTQFWMIERED